MTLLGLQIEVAAIVLGLITGMTYGLLAVGLVLIYRSSKIINFAHGQIGLIGTAVLGVTILEWHFPYWIAFPLGIAASAGFAALAEVVVVRRLARAPTVMTLVATLGVGQVAAAMGIALFSGAAAGNAIPTPSFFPEFSIGPLLIERSHSTILILSPVLVAAIAVFLRRSHLGVAIRGAASNSERARLVGISDRRMSMIVWALGGAISAYTAMLLVPTRGVMGAGEFGPFLLTRALIPAVLARMTNLPVSLAGGLLVGVIEEVVRWNYGGTAELDIMLLVLVLTVLLARKAESGRVQATGNYGAVQPWRPLPDAVAALRSVKRLPIVIGMLSLLAAGALPFLVSNYAAIVLVGVMSFAIIGLSVNLITGLGGEISLGQFGLAGIGATASYLVAFKTGNYVLALVVAAAVTAIASVVIGIPSLRVKGLMFAVTTLALASAVNSWLLPQSWMLSPAGAVPGRPVVGTYELATSRDYYFFALLVTVVAFLLARNFRRSGLSRVLVAVRDNEPAARAFSISPRDIKLATFGVAGALAGLGGAVYGHSLSAVDASAFPTEASVSVVVLAALGGIGILAGPFLGALYIIALPSFVTLDAVGLAATALGWLILLVYSPGGIVQLLAPVRHRLIRALAGRAGVDLDEAEAQRVGGGVGASMALEKLDVAPDVARPPAGSELLVATDLRKQFGGIRAVDGVSLVVHAGEILGVMGPNGAGKTTLFELLGGFHRPDHGRVEYLGEDITRLAPEVRARRGIVRSFQDGALFPTMTVLETLQVAQERAHPTRISPALVGRRAQDVRKERQARDIAAMMGLDSYRSHQIRELSTGTRRIVEIACLVTLQPTILLLDEPSAGIAQRETEALADVLRVIKERLDLTVVIIEHDIPLILGLAHRIVAMETGRIIATGSPQDIVQDVRVVASYLGTMADDVVPLVSPNANGPQRCAALTRRGERCSRAAKVDGLCSQHAALVAP